MLGSCPTRIVVDGQTAEKSGGTGMLLGCDWANQSLFYSEHPPDRTAAESVRAGLPAL